VRDCGRHPRGDASRNCMDCFRGSVLGCRRECVHTVRRPYRTGRPARALRQAPKQRAACRNRQGVAIPRRPLPCVTMEL
jgi:hypothetical protein